MILLAKHIVHHSQRIVQYFHEPPQSPSSKLQAYQVPSFCLHPTNPAFDLSATGRQSNMLRMSGACWMCISINSLGKTAIPTRNVLKTTRSWRWSTGSQHVLSHVSGIDRIEEKKWWWELESTEELDETEVWEPVLTMRDIWEKMLKKTEEELVFDDWLVWLFWAEDKAIVSLGASK